MFVNPRARKDARQGRGKRAWQIEAERESVSPPPARAKQESNPDPPAPKEESRGGRDGEARGSPKRSCRDVFGGGGSSHAAVAEGQNCVVFFDVETGGTHVKKGKPIGRLEMELFGRDCPKTVENFRRLCVGSSGLGKTTGLPLTYMDCPFHRIIPGFMAQGGDFQRGDGTGGESIYGGNFEDENFLHYHTTRGLLSMANSGRHTNGSQFFITFGRAAHLDGKHCVFGRVIGGFNVLDALEELGSKSGDPKQQARITNCGELSSPSGGGGATVHGDNSRRGRERADREERGHSDRHRRRRSRSRSRERPRRRRRSRSRGRDRERSPRSTSPRRRSRDRTPDRRHRSGQRSRG